MKGSMRVLGADGGGVVSVKTQLSGGGRLLMR